MRRACSSDVRSVSFLGRDGPGAGPGIDGVECTGGSRTSGGAIQAEAVDRLGDRRRHELVDRQPGRDPLADLGGRDRQRRDREQLDALRVATVTRSRASRSARSVPGRVAAPMRASSSTRSGRVQVGNAASSSAPSRKTGSASRELPRASRPYARTDRATPRRRRSARTRARRAADGARAPCRPPCAPGRRRRARAGARARSGRPPRGRAQRARCGVDRRRRRGSRPGRSLPDHDLVADLDLRARLHACGPQRLVELLALGRRPDDPESLAGAQHLEAAPLGRLRAVLEERRQRLVDRRELRALPVAGRAGRAGS